jgi:hypothetical protein
MVPRTSTAPELMRPNQVSPIALVAALAACAVEPEALNSERIEERFGSYGIEVLAHAEGVRRSGLYSITDGTRICRTYAVVQFEADATPRVAESHAEILAGESIGSTFKSSGWQIKKLNLHIGTMPMDPTHPIAQLMHLDYSTELGVHAYRLVLEQDSQSINYATIIEVHHPDYLTVAELKHLYVTNSEFRLQETDIRELTRLVLDQD